MSTRLAFVLEIPVSYRTGWLDHARASGLDIHEIYLAEGQSDRPWEGGASATSTVVRSADLGGTRSGFFPRLSRGLTEALDEVAPDLVSVPGWAHPAAWQVIWWCRRRKVPYVVMFETWRQQSQSRMPAPVAARIRDFVLEGAAAAWPISTRAEAFVKSLGVDLPTVVVHGNTCDADALAAVESDDRTGVLFVGRLLEHKGAALLPAVAELLADAGVSLTVIGDGPIRSAVDASRAIVLGAVPPSEVAAAMRAAQVVVVPSLAEPWGVVVHEALANGAAVVATDAVGSVDDLLDDAVGRVCSPDAAGLAEACLELLAALPEPERCRTAARRVTYVSATNELRRGIAAALGGGT